MPGRNMYRFLPLKHKTPMEKELPPRDFGIEMTPPGPGGEKSKYGEMPPPAKRTASMIAQDVVSKSIYRHRYDEEKQQSHKKRVKLLAILVTLVVAILLAILIAVLVTQLGKGSSGPPPLPESFLRLWPDLRSEDGMLEIDYNRSDITRYRPYMSNLYNALAPYRTMGTVVPGRGNCSQDGGNTNNNMTFTKPTCPYPVSDLLDGCTLSESYGFRNGTPCIFLALSMENRWDPRHCDNDTLDNGDGDAGDAANNVTEALMDLPYTLPDHVSVTCSWTKLDVNPQRGTLELLPKDGFPLVYYKNPNYKRLDPLVRIKLPNMKFPLGVEIFCSLCGGTDKESLPLHSVKFKLKIV